MSSTTVAASIALPAILCAGALVSAPARADSLLPRKIAAMYTGWIAPNDAERDLQADVVTRMLDPLAAAHFTAFYAKFQGAGDVLFDLSEPEQLARVRLVAEACQARGLALVAYTYHHPHHQRDPQRHAQYPPLVTAAGEVVDDRWGLANWETWRFISDEVFQLAQASRELPIAAVGIDIEVLLGAITSYDDQAWGDFAAERGLEAGLAAQRRGALVAEQGLTEEYRAWYARRWDDIVRRWCEEIHAINPDLSMCIMPAHEGNWLVQPFLVHAGTARAPAIIDHWGAYNGSGLTEDLLAAQERIKQLNPHNRFVLWYRPDSYRAEDIRVQIYHTLRETDGYCNWHIGMLLPAAEAPDEERAAAQALWQAYGEANELALADLAAGRGEPSIPFTPVEPLVAKLDRSACQGMPIPQLQPVGDGSGEDRWIPTRELQRFLIYARAGEQIAADIRHLAGQARPLALQYLLVGPGGEALRNEAVPPGAEESFAVDAPAIGTYALYVTGGSGGQAWYAVRVHTAWHAFPCNTEAGGTSQFFYVRALGPLELWLTRTDPQAPARLTVVTGEHQAIRAQVAEGGAREVLGESASFDLPTGDDPIRVLLEAPESLPEGFYVQHVALQVEGAVHSYLAVSPQRRLVPAD
ncbi:MAG: hypothetical protein AB7Y46_10455 [Armatimonadota bacterium]